MSLRAGVPNLAAGAVAVGRRALLRPARLRRHRPAVAGRRSACAAAVGLVQGIVVVGLQVPAWAAGLGVAVGLVVWIGTGASAGLTGAAYDPRRTRTTGSAASPCSACSAGLVGLIPALRRALGRFRPVADPAQRRGAVAAADRGGRHRRSRPLLAGTGGLLTVWSSPTGRRVATASS